MSKKPILYFFIFFALFFSGCTTTFAGTVFVLTFRDIILYVGLAFLMAVVIALKSTSKQTAAFWIWFLVSLFVTPLVGFVYVLILFTRKNKS
jgi:hypothetical protein